MLLGILGGLIYGRATGYFPVARDFWPVFGAIFMFRMIIYLYDVKHLPGPVCFKGLPELFLPASQLLFSALSRHRFSDVSK